MAFEFDTAKQLAVMAMSAQKNAPVAYSFNGESFSSAQLNAALREQFQELTNVDGHFNYRTYKKNQNTIFELIEKTIDEVLPPRVEAQYAQFADVETVAQGDAYVYKVKVTEASKRRAKTFVSRVGLAARYETFMLDGAEMEIKTSAIGGAARIGFEEFLDGRWEFSEFTSLMLEALDELIYTEIIKAMANMVASLPAANKAEFAGFDEDTMDELLAIVDVYGKATIYCTQEFANKMIPSTARMSNEMKNELWKKGWLGDYKGHNVIILDQSLVWNTAEPNTTKVVDPSVAYLIPTGSEKPVKIVFEGATQVREVENQMDDWSREIQTYTKVGVGTVATLGQLVWIGSYKNTDLKMATRN
jgi:hypothetical protein